MPIDANSFRDKKVQSVRIAYDWKEFKHFAEICLTSDIEDLCTYRVSGLSDYNISENFGAMHIEQCTLSIIPGRVYLSLDPHTEGTESERDNFTFTGIEIMNCRWL